MGFIWTKKLRQTRLFFRSGTYFSAVESSLTLKTSEKNPLPIFSIWKSSRRYRSDTAWRTAIHEGVDPEDASSSSPYKIIIYSIRINPEILKLCRLTVAVGKSPPHHDGTGFSARFKPEGFSFCIVRLTPSLYFKAKHLICLHWTVFFSLRDSSACEEMFKHTFQFLINHFSIFSELHPLCWVTLTELAAISRKADNNNKQKREVFVYRAPTRSKG